MTTSEADVHALMAQLHELTAAGPDAWTDVDLTFTQLRALFFLGQQPLRVSDLAAALHMSLASASALSDRLVRLGFISRRTDPADRRSVLLEVAQPGARLVRRLRRAQTYRVTRAIRQMSEDERRALVITLRAFLRLGPMKSPRGPRPMTTSGAR